MDAEGQAIAGGVDRADDGVQLAGSKAYQVQDGAEVFLVQRLDASNFERRRRDKMTLQAARQSRFGNQLALALERGDMRQQAGLGLGIDHRADVVFAFFRGANLQFGHGALEQIDDPLGNVVLYIEHAQGRATLTGAGEGRLHGILDHLLGQGGGVDDHRVLAAGFGDQCGNRAGLVGQHTVDDPRGVGGAGEAHPRQAGIAAEHATQGGTVARQEGDHIARQAGFEHQLQGAGGNQAGLLGRLGQHAVTGQQRGADLAQVNGQREVPRADAGENPTAFVEQLVALAGRALQLFTAQAQTRLLGVVTAEIHRLAHFIDAVLQGLAGFQGTQGHQLAALGFKQIGQALEDRCALLNRGGIPARPGGGQGIHGLTGLRGAGELGSAEHLALLVRAAYVLGGAVELLAVDHRRGMPLTVEVRLIGKLKGLHGSGNIHVEALGVFSRAAKQRRRQGDFVIGEADELAQLRHRMIDQGLHRHAGIDQLMDER